MLAKISVWENTSHIKSCSDNYFSKEGHMLTQNYACVFYTIKLLYNKCKRAENVSSIRAFHQSFVYLFKFYYTLTSNAEKSLDFAYLSKFKIFWL